MQWSLGLITEDYIYMCNFEEQDENGNTKIYDRYMNLLSDNFLANNALMEEMENIHAGRTKIIYISPEILNEIRIREEVGYFDN